MKGNAYHCPAGMLFSSLCVSKDLAIYNNSDLQYTVEGYEGKLSLCSILLIFLDKMSSCAKNEDIELEL